MFDERNLVGVILRHVVSAVLLGNLQCQSLLPECCVGGSSEE